MHGARSVNETFSSTQSAEWIGRIAARVSSTARVNGDAMTAQPTNDVYDMLDEPCTLLLYSPMNLTRDNRAVTFVRDRQVFC